MTCFAEYAVLTSLVRAKLALQMFFFFASGGCLEDKRVFQPGLDWTETFKTPQFRLLNFNFWRPLGANLFTPREVAESLILGFAI